MKSELFFLFKNHSWSRDQSQRLSGIMYVRISKINKEELVLKHGKLSIDLNVLKKLGSNNPFFCSKIDKAFHDLQL